MLVVLGLDLILFLAERSNSQSAITTYFDAVLYSLTTITNFGYSEIFPTTSIGRSVGFFFQVLNIGFYLLIISAGIAFVRRRLKTS
ncbi:ion channel [Marinoscillum furvescens]